MFIIFPDNGLDDIYKFTLDFKSIVIGCNMVYDTPLVLTCQQHIFYFALIEFLTNLRRLDFNCIIDSSSIPLGASNNIASTWTLLKSKVPIGYNPAFCITFSMTKPKRSKCKG